MAWVEVIADENSAKRKDRIESSKGRRRSSDWKRWEAVSAGGNLERKIERLVILTTLSDYPGSLSPAYHKKVILAEL